MNPPLKRSAPLDRGRAGQEFESLPNNATGTGNPQRKRAATGQAMSETPDVFAEARDAYMIADVWQMLRLPGEPKASCRSPFRDERNPSFGIFDNGKAWKDHGSGEGGDVIEFIKRALDTDYQGVREWLQERLGIDCHDAPPRPQDEPRKVIQWPGDLLTGDETTWGAFAAKMRMTPLSVKMAVQCGMLRFTRVNGVRCYVVTDESRRAAEIRRCDGGMFGQTKAFPLAGVDKSWLPGADLLKGSPKSTSIIVTEGPKDLLAALSHYTRYRRTGGKNSWCPMALLGAKCKRLHPELVPWFRGRRVRLVPDGDDAGDEMADHWKALLLDLGCTVDVVKMPRGKDLFDLAHEIEPEGLFA